MGLERLSLAQLAAGFGGDNQLAATAARESTPGVITTEAALAADAAASPADTAASAVDAAASAAGTADTAAAAAHAGTTPPAAALAPLRVGKYHASAPSG